VQGTSTIQVYVKLNFDPNQALTEVLAKVNSVKYLIPKESNDPIVTKTTGQTTAVMYLGFSSDELSGSAISDYLHARRPARVVDGRRRGIGRHSRRPDVAMRLWLDPVRMAGRGVSPSDVSAAIAANNFQAAAGQAKGYFIVSNIQTNTDLRNLDQFKKMIVKSKGRRLRADRGYRNRRTRRPKLGCECRVQRRTRDLHRRAGDATRATR